MSSDKKRAFIISPIGPPESDIRKRSDDVKEMLIKPIVENEFGFECKRADESYENPKIDDDIINHLIEDELVIADLTDHNANVFYELAVRHSIQKPVILLIEKPQKIPFDITTYRAIFYDFNDVKVFKAAEEELRRQVKAVVDGKFIPDSPIKGSLLSLERSDSDPDKWNEILTILRNHSEILSELNNKIETSTRIPTTLLSKIEPVTPFTVRQAIPILRSQGFQFVEREINEVPEISGYETFLFNNWAGFSSILKRFYDPGEPYVNLSKEPSLWFWNKENQQIYIWKSVDFKRTTKDS